MKRRVVVTGLGLVTPLGTETDRVWKLLTEGKSGVGPITLFDASTFPVRIAAEVRNWDISEVGEAPEQWQKHARQTQFAVAAAMKAARQAGLDGSSVPPLRIGVHLGCGEVFPDLLPFGQSVGAALREGEFQLDQFVDHARVSSFGAEELSNEPCVAVGYIASRLHAQGPSANYTTACTSASVAIGEALETIRRGDADVMFAGGAHSMIHPLGITGFHRLSTLSTRNDEPERASRPFDGERDGFVVGEGGAVLALESLDHARRRGAHVWAELTGYGTSHDAFRVTDPHPAGRGCIRAMSLALADARLDLEDVDYINAHGTSTIANDRVESVAIKTLFQQKARTIPVSSTKSMTGHLTTACGALELAVSVMTVHNAVIPPTINYETPDKQCDLDYVPNQAREFPCRHVLSNNAAFGGQNVSLVVSRYPR